VLTATTVVRWPRRRLYMRWWCRHRDLSGVVTEPEPAEFNAEIGS
jgi:hypothetical protein